MRRILKVTGNIYMPMKEGETLEEAGDRFDELLDHSVEFASYKMAIVDDDGNEIETEEGVPVSTPSRSATHQRLSVCTMNDDGLPLSCTCPAV